MLALISSILNNTFQSLNAFNIGIITDLYSLLQNISKKQNCFEWWIFAMCWSHCICITMTFNKTLLIGSKYGSNSAMLNLETSLGELSSSGKQEWICNQFNIRDSKPEKKIRLGKIPFYVYLKGEINRNLVSFQRYQILLYSACDIEHTKTDLSMKWLTASSYYYGVHDPTWQNVLYENQTICRPTGKEMRSFRCDEDTSIEVIGRAPEGPLLNIWRHGNLETMQSTSGPGKNLE